MTLSRALGQFYRCVPKEVPESPPLSHSWLQHGPQRTGGSALGMWTGQIGKVVKALGLKPVVHKFLALSRYLIWLLCQ